MPFPPEPYDGTTFVKPELHEVNEMLRQSGELLDDGTVEKLMAQMKQGFVRSDALKYGTMGSVLSERACILLAALAPKNTLLAALRRHSANASDSYYRYLLLELARAQLPIRSKLVVLGEALDDDREGWPKAWSMEGVQGTQYNRQNRICDFAYLWMREALEKDFNVEREDSLETAAFRGNLSAFKEWWRENGEKVVAGERIPFVPPVVVP